MAQGSKLVASTAGLKRRRLMAAGAALATGVLTELMAKPAAAGHTGSDPTVLQLGEQNKTTAATWIISSSYPLIGSSTGAPGLKGDSYSSDSSGVEGSTFATPREGAYAAGVRGDGVVYGVLGLSRGEPGQATPVVSAVYGKSIRIDQEEKVHLGNGWGGSANLPTPASKEKDI
jgi:hypothetical protein